MRRLSILVVAALCLSLSLVACRQALTPIDHSSTSSLTGLDITADGLSSTELPDASHGGLSQNGFYPLAVGNRWTYHDVFELKVDYFDGSPSTSDRVESDIEWAQVCEETHFGRPYMVQRETTVDPFGTFVFWFRERQDPRGLYGLEIFDPPACAPAAPAPSSSVSPRGRVTESEARGRMGPGSWSEDLSSRLVAKLSRSMTPDAARATTAAILDKAERFRAIARDCGRRHGRPGGPQAGELFELSYPLRIGKQWVFRDDDVHIERKVTGIEVRDVLGKKTLAYRIHLISDLFGDTDADLFYSRRGFLGLKVSGTSLAVDDQGNPIGIVTSVETRTVTGIHVDRPFSFEKDLRAAE
jgi:hypothetical protein